MPAARQPAHLPTAHALCADWLAAAPTLAPASIDLLYADPPFNTGRAQRTPPNAKRAGREVDASYTDTFGTARDFITWLRPRLVATLPALRPSGAILLHLDWRTSHHARILLDELLGQDCFVNHLIWSYGLGGSSPRRFARKHDDILFYSRTPDAHYFEAPRIPATSARLRGQTKKMTDVLDIPSLNNMAAERTGYPTQKPLALLTTLITACCPADGTILDPCCGSGTTLLAAVQSGRKAIGFDISSTAIELTTARLRSMQSTSSQQTPRKA